MVGQSDNPYGEFDRGILQAIGLAVIKFSQLEEGLVFGVTCLLVGKRYDEAVDFMVRKLQFQGLLDTFGGLYRHRYPDDDFRDLKEVCKQLEDLNGERIHLFHSLWTPGEAADQLRRYRMKVNRDGPKIWDMSFKEADILRFAEQADQVCERLVLFVAERILQRIDDVIAKARSKQSK